MRVRHRILFGLIAVSLVGAALVAAGSHALIRDAVRERFLERIDAETALLGEWLADGPDRSFQETAIAAGQRLRLRVSLIAADGVVLGDSARDSEGLARMDNHLGRPEMQQALIDGTGRSVRTSATTRVEYFYVARRLGSASQVKFVRIALPSTEVRQVQQHYGWLVLAVVAASVFLICLLGYFAVWRLSRPVEILAAAVSRSAEDGKPIDVPDTGGLEFDRLRDSVRSMQLALLEKVGQLDTERSLLSSVIAGIREGLLLVGSDGRVRLANAALRGVLGIDFDPEGRPIAEVVRHPIVVGDIEKALRQGGPSFESVLKIPATGRSFALQVVPLQDPDRDSAHEALVLFFDITRMERLEAVRREFVANVSHELRTPLTSIRAFVETLIDGGLDDRDNATKFLQIVHKHSDRMGELIDDLTDLSLIETGAISLEFRPVEVADVAQGVVERLLPQASAGGVDVSIEIPSPFTVNADRRRLEQMLVNLVENAIKFSPEGSVVRVRGKREGFGATISVLDTGIGIPESSLEKIFNRFYQENRDRSKKIGGTGLGLAIVKHLMRLHGGQVRVESELGRGAEFFLEFPPSAGMPGQP